MNLHAHAHRPALRAAISVALLAGIVTSVMAAYRGYQALAPTAQREPSGGGGPAASEPAAAAAVGSGLSAARPMPASSPRAGGPAAPVRTPEVRWPAGPVPGWGLSPASLAPSTPASGWTLAPAVGSPPASPGAGGGWSAPMAPWAWGRQPAIPQPGLSPSRGPARAEGKACGAGFGMGFG